MTDNVKHKVWYHWWSLVFDSMTFMSGGGGEDLFRDAGTVFENFLFGISGFVLLGSY